MYLILFGVLMIENENLVKFSLGAVSIPVTKTQNLINYNEM